MPPALVTVVMVIVVTDVVLASFLIAWAVRSYWSPIAAHFPPCEPAADAVRRGFQSFSAGLLNLGWSIHVAADADYLHLRPALLARLLRIRPTSIPWPAVVLDRHDSRRRTRRATIAGHELQGPRWCLELANPSSAT